MTDKREAESQMTQITPEEVQKVLTLLDGIGLGAGYQTAKECSATIHHLLTLLAEAHRQILTLSEDEGFPHLLPLTDKLQPFAALVKEG